MSILFSDAILLSSLKLVNGNNETGQLALDLHEALEDDDAIERWLEYSQQFLVGFC